jgi:lysozyme
VNLGALGTALIQSFEQLRLVGYLDQRGVPTNGWGHTGPDVQVGQPCTKEQADAWFAADTQNAVRGVDNSLTVFCTQNQFDALVSFTFNVGVGAEAHSTLIKLMNAGDIQGAAAQFLVWDHINGVPNAGLLRRRQAEQALFLS